MMEGKKGGDERSAPKRNGPPQTGREESAIAYFVATATANADGASSVQLSAFKQSVDYVLDLARLPFPFEAARLPFPLPFLEAVRFFAGVLDFEVFLVDLEAARFFAGAFFLVVFFLAAVEDDRVVFFFVDADRVLVPVFFFVPVVLRAGVFFFLGFLSSSLALLLLLLLDLDFVLDFARVDFARVLDLARVDFGACFFASLGLKRKLCLF